jgi:hypothetical protein
LPIRASARRSGGWRSLIVGVSRDGARAPDAELRYDGTSYPSNPIAAPPHRDAKTITQVVIPQYDSLDTGTVLTARESASSESDLGP